ncbi:MAG: hypothetical protein ACTS8R_06285 [Arsenophonus sp. NC-QC1-MAG3]
MATVKNKLANDSFISRASAVTVTVKKERKRLTTYLTTKQKLTSQKVTIRSS